MQQQDKRCRPIYYVWKYYNITLHVTLLKILIICYIILFRPLPSSATASLVHITSIGIDMKISKLCTNWQMVKIMDDPLHLNEGKFYESCWYFYLWLLLSMKSNIMIYIKLFHIKMYCLLCLLFYVSEFNQKSSCSFVN